MCTFANSKDPDEMSHNVGISSGSALFVKKKRSSEMQFYFEKCIQCIIPNLLDQTRPRGYKA